MTRGREHTYAASKLVRNQCKQRKNGRTISNKALHLCSDVQNPPQFRNVGVAASRCENSGRGQLMKLGDISRKNAVSRAHPGITCDNSKIRSGDGNRRSCVEVIWAPGPLLAHVSMWSLCGRAGFDVHGLKSNIPLGVLNGHFVVERRC